MTSEAKHTPGPWSYTGEAENDFVVYAGGDYLANVAGGRVTPLHAPDKRGVVAFDIEDQANARLIAAAPELLEACRLLVAGCDRFDGPTLAEVEQAQAAISKATGEDA